MVYAYKQVHTSDVRSLLDASHLVSSHVRARASDGCAILGGIAMFQPTPARGRVTVLEWLERRWGFQPTPARGRVTKAKGKALSAVFQPTPARGRVTRAGYWSRRTC